MWLNYGILAAICALAVAQSGPPDDPTKKGTASVHSQVVPGIYPFPHPLPYPPMPPYQPYPMPPAHFPYPHPPFFPPLPFPMPPPPPPVPPIDKYVCTLDAQILTVLHPSKLQPIIPPVHIGPSQRTKREDPDVGLGIMGPCVPGYPSQRCGNTVRIRCAETAVVDSATCTACCQMASREPGVRKDEIRGILIDSKQITPNKPIVGFPKPPYVGSHNNRQKRHASPFPLPLPLPEPQPPIPPPSCVACAAAVAPCPTVKCMCCAPRMVPHHPFPFPPPTFAFYGPPIGIPLPKGSPTEANAQQMK